jgi:hypothetical protein
MNKIFSELAVVVLFWNKQQNGQFFFTTQRDEIADWLNSLFCIFYVHPV